MAAGYALAGQTEENRQQAWACYEAKDWACAFDAMIDDAMAVGEKACASDPRHGCDYEMMALYDVAFAYAESQRPSVRISFSDRSLLALSSLTTAEIGAQDDLLMNGMKYSACRTLKNTRKNTTTPILLYQFSLHVRHLLLLQNVIKSGLLLNPRKSRRQG
jgi:hypothetical protein